MYNTLVMLVNSVTITLMCVILQCLFMLQCGAEPGEPSNNEKSANAPPPTKNVSRQISQPANGGEKVNHTSSNFILNDTATIGSHDTKLSPGAVLRGFYVFVGLGAIVVMYIVVRTIRLRKKKTIRKYGILASREDVEMTPLGAEDEDEDTTLFDVNNHSRP